MKKLALLLFVLLNFACENTVISSSKELTGYYETNPLLDFRCIALPDDKMPNLNISKSGEVYTIKLKSPNYNSVSKQYEMVESTYKDITTSEEAGNINLTYNGKKLGYFGIPTNYTGDDKTKRLVLNYEDKETNTYLFFIGEKK